MTPRAGPIAGALVALVGLGLLIAEAAERKANATTDALGMPAVVDDARDGADDERTGAADWEARYLPHLGYPTEQPPAPEVPDAREGPARVRVPAGPFLMGDPSLPGASPARRVVLSDYFIDRTEVTRRRYRDWCERLQAGDLDGDVPDSCNTLDEGSPDHPMTQVTQPEASRFCADADGRLPSEAEWEKAMRGADGRRWPWGDRFELGASHSVTALSGPLTSRAHWQAFLARVERGEITADASPLPVGSRGRDVSPYGAADAHGNAMEWVDGSYGPYPLGSIPAPELWNGRIGIVRGVGPTSADYAAPLAARFPYPTEWRDGGLGFRCAYGTDAP